MRVAQSVLLAFVVSIGLAGNSVLARQQTQPYPDFAKPFFGFDAVTGESPMLTIFWDPHRPEHPAPTRKQVEDLLFGAGGLQGYFLENSSGLFTLTNAGFLGWYDADKPAEHYWADADEGDKDGDGWVNGHVEKWTEAIRKADAEFDFAPYDVDKDGVLSPRELGIHIVIPENNPFGTNRQPAGREFPEWQPLVVDGVTIPVIAESYIGAPPNLPLTAHELAHLFLNTPDEYFWFANPCAAGVFSLMDNQGYGSHLDPFLKLRLGWVTPRFVTSGGSYTVRAVEKGGEVLVLCDPERSASEYFLVENRWPEDSYERALPDRGLAVWHIVDDPELYAQLPAPPGCAPEDWAQVPADDWGRKAIRLIRPVQPMDNARTLWDGSEPETGYDLLSSDPDPAHATLAWADGTPSGFSIHDIPAAGPEVTVRIERDAPAAP